MRGQQPRETQGGWNQARKKTQRDKKKQMARVVPLSRPASRSPSRATHSTHTSPEDHGSPSKQALEPGRQRVGQFRKPRVNKSCRCSTDKKPAARASPPHPAPHNWPQTSTRTFLSTQGQRAGEKRWVRRQNGSQRPGQTKKLAKIVSLHNRKNAV